MYHDKFQVAEHHEVIAEALEKVLTGEITRLIINVPPRSGKTELGVKNFIAHGLALNPSAKFIHLSYADSLALDNSECARDIVKSAEYQELFPYVQIKGSTDSKKKWYTTQNGGVYATSTGGQVTGYGAGKIDPEDQFDEDEFNREIDGLVSKINQESEHYIQRKMKFNGAIIIDDPIKPDDADSEIIRGKVNNRFNSTIRNRVNSTRTPIIIIMQRLHEEDLCGHLIETEKDDWTVIKLPAIKENGESFWPHRWPLEKLYVEEARDAVIFSRQYMQEPMPKEGLLFPLDELQIYNPAEYDPYEHSEYRMGVIDPADDGADYLAYPSGALIGNKFYITDVQYNRHGTDITEGECVDNIIKTKPNITIFEGNSGWIVLGKAIRRKIQEAGSDSELKIIKSTANKRTKIIANAAWIKKYCVFRSDYNTNPELRQYRAFIKNLTSYMRVQASSNEQDGAPDTLAILGQYMQKQFAHLY